ncbi:hypothetical protein K435DRAFT_848008 [Dendrothele bispora CBS 962.96]|uniref:RRM domain-containing protein n=1 Tax=Dendrothele bispora (strain CBS 962.96) TaxID=1314807 RepID=A0A4S8MWZ7_DENBC|nr:hypothetical protein K435DRAFT_848008 [Dendrothele bispora CBS 962.96]
MDDQPYTIPEEDPFNIQPLLLQPRRKRSSMLDKWIQDQQRLPINTDIHDLTNESSPFQSGTRSNPYLAYPDLSTTAARHTSPNVSSTTLASFDLVEDDDIPRDVVPDMAFEISSSSQRSPKFFGTPRTPTSLKNLHISFRSNSPSTQSISSPTSSRMSFLSSRFASGLNKTPTKQHTRSSSVSTLETATSSVTPQSPIPTTKWRPSVLGYFSSSQVSMDPSEVLYPPPRPSMSSSITGTSTGTFVASPTSPVAEKETPGTPTKIFKLKSRRHSHGSLLQAAKVSTTITEGSDSGSCRLKSEASKAGNVRLPFAPKPTSRTANYDTYHDDDEDDAAPVQASRSTRPEVAFASSSKSGTMPRVALSTLGTRNQKKKKKLVVSGVSPNDLRKFEGVKRWCESFGEVTHIVRMPNGDLVVHFRSADVADTVCRLRAQVFIAGVGSCPRILNYSSRSPFNRFIAYFLERYFDDVTSIMPL